MSPYFFGVDIFVLMLNCTALITFTYISVFLWYSWVVATTYLFITRSGFYSVATFQPRECSVAELTTFDELILKKIIKIVAIRCHILKLKCTKSHFGWGSAPDPAGIAYRASPDLLARFKGPTSKGSEGEKSEWTEGRGPLHFFRTYAHGHSCMSCESCLVFIMADVRPISPAQVSACVSGRQHFPHCNSEKYVDR